MIKVLFICHGNICRSPMAEAVFRDMVNKRGLSDGFHIESRATSSEELGNPVHRGTRKKLAEYNIGCDGMYSQKLTKKDIDEYDFNICMDENNMRNIKRMFGSFGEDKIFKLLDFSNRKGDIADPWYTGNFDETWDDVNEGLEGFLRYLYDTDQI